jgi:hypothetical protein
MKILIDKTEVQEVQAVIDLMLKSAGIQAFQIATKMLNSIEVVDDVAPNKGIEPEKQNSKKVLD